MEQSISRINGLSASQATSEFLKCCGSVAWAKRMSDARPFGNQNELLSRADEILASLTKDDLLEAFRAHPKIGEKKAVATQSAQAEQWSAQEQARAQQATAETKLAIAKFNSEYERRFGYIFIVFATGKSAEDVLASLKKRLLNDPQAELLVAADEQRKITHLRLKKLLEH